VRRVGTQGWKSRVEVKDGSQGWKSRMEVKGGSQGWNSRVALKGRTQGWNSRVELKGGTQGWNSRVELKGGTSLLSYLLERLTGREASTAASSLHPTNPRCWFHASYESVLSAGIVASLPLRLSNI